MNMSQILTIHCYFLQGANFVVCQSLLDPQDEVHEAPRAPQNPIHVSLTNEDKSSKVNNSISKKSTFVIYELLIFASNYLICTHLKSIK